MFVETAARSRTAGAVLAVSSCLRFLSALARLDGAAWAAIAAARQANGSRQSSALEELARISSSEGAAAIRLASIRAADENVPQNIIEAASLAAQAVLYRDSVSPATFTELYRPFKQAIPTRILDTASPAYFTKLTFRAGPVPTAPSLELAPGPVLLIVGPNNSGKSQCLREIEGWCVNGTEPPLVLSKLEFQFPVSIEEAIDLLEPLVTVPQQNQAGAPQYLMVAYHTPTGGPATRQVGVNQIRSALITPSGSDRLSLLTSHTLRLDGRTRFNLCNPTTGGDLLVQPPQNHLWSLFANQTALSDVDSMVHRAFSRHLVIDPSMLGQFRIRLSDQPQTAAETGWTPKAMEFYRQARPITEFGDGVQAFVGLVAAVMSLLQRVLLVDEPEAFLHPPLARMLGANLARTMRRRGGTLVVSTHSAEFVMGCIETSTEVSVVRLEYSGGIATARALPSTELAGMMRNPLVRSTQALQGLFHRSVVISESDGDRTFYAEINRRLTDAGRGLDDSLFINARGWTSIGQMVGPLRKLGIPAACVIDFDAIARPGAEWNTLFRAMNLSQRELDALRIERAAVEKVVRANPKSLELGLRSLRGHDRQIVLQLITDLADLGVFIVPNGALESWLRYLGVQGQKDAWVARMLDRLQADDVKPRAADVWSFMGGIASWTNNPSRLGMGS